MKNVHHKILGLAVLVAALVLVPVAQGKPTSSTSPMNGTTSTYLRALHVRSQALNEKYGPINALMLRSEALNVKYGLGDQATARNVGYLRARHIPTASLSQYGDVSTQVAPAAAQSSGGIDFRDGAIGSAALFVTILIVGTAIVRTNRRGLRPLSA